MNATTLVIRNISLDSLSKASKIIIHLCLIALLCASTSVFAQSYRLAPNAWAMLTIPANPDNTTLGQLLGDELEGLEFGVDLLMYTYDSAAGSYEQPSSLDSVLTAGQAFWIIQRSSASVELSLPAELEPPERQYTESCAGPYGCFVFPLPDGASAKTQFHLIGAPFSTDVNVDDVRFTTNLAGSACVTGCTLDEASAASYVSDILFTYDPSNNRYDMAGMGDVLNPWQGFWFKRKPEAYGKAAQLEFPFAEPEAPQANVLRIVDVPGSSVITRQIELKADLVFNSNRITADVQGVTWSVSPTESVQFINDNTFRIVDDGNIEIVAQYEDLTASKTIAVLAYEDLAVPSALSTEMQDSIALMNVLIISYLPTKDGVNLDVTKAPDYFTTGKSTLTDLQQRIANFNVAGKFMLEEGSKFRGYKRSDAPPYLGYRILRHINVYEQIAADTRFVIGQNAYEPNNPAAGTFPSYQPNYRSEFERLNVVQYIQDHDIDEVWLWYAEPAKPGWPSFDATLHSVDEPHVGFVESNMASPTTGDISNSYRYEIDLPIVDHTYVVYAYNFRRTQNEMVHNHGHQLESIYKYAAIQQDGNNDLFVADFSGWGKNYSSPPLGRAGDTHHPVNTTTDYDYNNSTLVESDIEDWNPNGTGERQLINRNTWASIPYDWPDYLVGSNLGEPAWYVYWMQNMPGYQNDIPYNDDGATMRNWWEFTADWDKSIASGNGLWVNE